VPEVSAVKCILQRGAGVGERLRRRKRTVTVESSREGRDADKADEIRSRFSYRQHEVGVQCQSAPVPLKSKG
jgi:hypothetical protein